MGLKALCSIVSGFGAKNSILEQSGRAPVPFPGRNLAPQWQAVYMRKECRPGKIKGLVHRNRDILAAPTAPRTVSSLSGEGGSPSDGEESRPTL